jgi:hypothetical protein
MFSSPIEYAKELLGQSNASAKTSPIVVATYLERFSQTSEASLKEALAHSAHSTERSFRWIEEDTLIQIGLGRFFAGKLRAAVAWSIFEHTGEKSAGTKALELYQVARDAWATMAKRAALPYVQDITYGSIPQRREDWEKRLPAIDQDLAVAKTKVSDGIATKGKLDSAVISRALSAVDARPAMSAIKFSHTPPTSFKPGEPLIITISKLAASKATLFYRHVNQAERWQTMVMSQSTAGLSASIPSEYTQSTFPLQYYFVVPGANSGLVSLPQWDAAMSNQPYYAVWKRA